ncbi:LysR family transcriptional regulator [Variovorax guangxiensis]|uniref:LysR family transcriptional regulator n=1 Tax=Variovorax guangxiensis TaxID=1775474 RepID=A0A433MTU2_9BURK|nr:LysR family transcriptional regulator [Variovorax guangxiensis]RUR71283.1 LysR family transcriptional regulator [Variovorax guangxiensis]
MLDLNDVAMFVEVARCGSFSEAARRLRMPPATISKRIQRLEMHLGARLMQRSTRKLTLTNAGQIFRERCSPAVEDLMGATQQQVTDSQEPSGLVRVAAPDDFFKFFRMEWISAFLDSHPLVRLEFVLSDFRADLISERIDVAFRGGPIADSSHVVRKVFNSYGQLLASPAYLAARGTPATPEELMEHECMISQQDSNNCTTWRLRRIDGFELDAKVSGRFVSNSQDVLRSAACAGLGIAALPHVLTLADVAQGNLVPVLPQYRRTGRGLSIIYASRQQLPKAVSAFVEMAVEKLDLFEWALPPGSGLRSQSRKLRSDACEPSVLSEVDEEEKAKL